MIREAWSIAEVSPPLESLTLDPSSPGSNKVLQSNIVITTKPIFTSRLCLMLVNLSFGMSRVSRRNGAYTAFARQAYVIEAIMIRALLKSSFVVFDLSRKMFIIWTKKIAKPANTNGSYQYSLAEKIFVGINAKTVRRRFPTTIVLMAYDISKTYIIRFMILPIWKQIENGSPMNFEK